MENLDSAAEAIGLPVIGTPWRAVSPLPVPTDFVPLCLVLQPSGVRIELKQPDMLVGRHSLADVRLPLPDVSRRHCRFLFAQGFWQIIDLNSLNGLYLNGEPIRQATVRHGDLIRIGGFSFAIELSEVTEAEDSAGLIRGLFHRACDALPNRRAS